MLTKRWQTTSTHTHTHPTLIPPPATSTSARCLCSLGLSSLSILYTKCMALDSAPMGDRGRGRVNPIIYRTNSASVACTRVSRCIDFCCMFVHVCFGQMKHWSTEQDSVRANFSFAASSINDCCLQLRTSLSWIHCCINSRAPTRLQSLMTLTSDGHWTLLKYLLDLAEWKWS